MVILSPPQAGCVRFVSSARRNFNVDECGRIVCGRMDWEEIDTDAPLKAKCRPLAGMACRIIEL